MSSRLSYVDPKDESFVMYTKIREFHKFFVFQFTKWLKASFPASDVPPRYDPRSAQRQITTEGVLRPSPSLGE